MKWLASEVMDLLYFDNHILAVVKPAGMLTQPTQSCSFSLQEQMKKWLRRRKQKQGQVFLHPIHRLDKEVSGLVLFAYTQKALSRLQAMQRERKIQKSYLAWVEGTPTEKGEIKNFIKKISYKAVISTPYEGKEAILVYQTIKRKKKASLLDIHLVTGRYHQIRVQLANLGHPILGDKKYGSSYPKEALLLHHYQMQFLHPVSKGPLKIVDSKGESYMKSVIL